MKMFLANHGFFNQISRMDLKSNTRMIKDFTFHFFFFFLWGEGKIRQKAGLKRQTLLIVTDNLRRTEWTIAFFFKF